MSGRKRSLPESEEGSRGNPKKKRSSKEAKPLDPKKFGGKTEEEVCQMLLPDHMGPGLDIIFVSFELLYTKQQNGNGFVNSFKHQRYVWSFFLCADGYQSRPLLSVPGTSLLQR